MTERTQKLLDEVLALPSEEQAEFLDLLSTYFARHHGFASPEIAEEWDAEIERRLEEVDSGKVKALSQEEFWERMRSSKAKHDV